MNCKLPLSYSLPVRLAFLLPNVSTLRIGNWSGMQCTLADFFRLKQLISKENSLLKILSPGMVKIFQTGSIPSVLKINLAEIISKIFRKSSTDWLVESLSDLFCHFQTCFYHCRRKRKFEEKQLLNKPMK